MRERGLKKSQWVILLEDCRHILFLVLNQCVYETISGVTPKLQWHIREHNMGQSYKYGPDKRPWCLWMTSLYYQFNSKMPNKVEAMFWKLVFLLIFLSINNTNFEMACSPATLGIWLVGADRGQTISQEPVAEVLIRNSIGPNLTHVEIHSFTAVFFLKAAALGLGERNGFTCLP